MKKVGDLCFNKTTQGANKLFKDKKHIDNFKFKMNTKHRRKLKSFSWIGSVEGSPDAAANEKNFPFPRIGRKSWKRSYPRFHPLHSLSENLALLTPQCNFNKNQMHPLHPHLSLSANLEKVKMNPVTSVINLLSSSSRFQRGKASARISVNKIIISS